MQMVLWKPPGELIKNTVTQVVTGSEDKTSVQPQIDNLCETDSCCDIPSDDRDAPVADVSDPQQRYVIILLCRFYENVVNTI